MNVMPDAFADHANRCRAGQRTWARTSIAVRLEPVARLRRLLVRDADRLSNTVDRELGRPAAEVLATDVLPLADAFRFLQQGARKILAPRSVSIWRRPLWLFGQSDTVHRRPHGVVGIIGTWNYPVFLNGVQIVQALTAGNGVLWKPSELMPETASVLHSLLLEAGYSPDLVQMLPATRAAGPALLEAPIDHVVFTGSAAVGRKIAARLGERLISSTLELSGCDPMFVLADADVPLAARAAWFGATLNKGQTCLAVRRIFVHRSVQDVFVDALRPWAESAVPVNLALASQVNQAEKLIAEAVGQGARLLNPARSPAQGGSMTPAVLLDATPTMGICRDAMFAPVTAVLPFGEMDEALAKNAQCEYGLGASVFTSNPIAAERLAGRLAVGSVSVNDVIAPTGHPATPFGGRGTSGWGATQGEEGLLAMTAMQVVSRRSGTFRPHYQPMVEGTPTTKLTRGLLEWCHGGWSTQWRGLRRLIGNAWRMIR